jgi:dephospho-CoA kinase
LSTKRAIGLTGGIASGKSFVSDQFAALGAQIIDTDLLAREVLAPGSVGLQCLVEALGPAILDVAGALNRRALRERVFADATARAVLEAITHPRIRGLVLERATQSVAAPYAVVVVPLMAEKGRYDFLHEIVVVDCCTETQMTRLMQRDGITESLARQMLSAQATRSVRLAIADHVLTNDLPDRSDLCRSIARLHARFTCR